MKLERSSGVLLHLTSLPTDFGIGDLGPSAYRFADLLLENGQAYWQILPLRPTSQFNGNVPYNSDSSFAGNPLLVSPELLAREGLLQDVGDLRVPASSRIDYDSVEISKGRMLERAYAAFRERFRDYQSEFEDFCVRERSWLDDYALFQSIKEASGQPWFLWPAPLRDRDPSALEEKGRALAGAVERTKFVQFLFYRQWDSLSGYCRGKGLRLFGDLPIYVSYDSADVWAHPGLFKLDSAKRPLFISGVPPDYFSETGQLWGNPVYDWEAHRTTGFSWWMDRIRQNLRGLDAMRLDHFRGLVGYWEVPAGETTAVRGRWVTTPSDEFFGELRRRFPEMPFIAEDLGVITDDVKEAIRKLGLPGMRVLIFGFSGGVDNPNKLFNHTQNSVVYTGTHDNNTARGWFVREATPAEKAELACYTGKEVSEENVSWEMIRLALISVSSLCIIPMQDILSLGEDARMNRPASPSHNYEWRLMPGQMEAGGLRRLGEMCAVFGRAGARTAAL